MSFPRGELPRWAVCRRAAEIWGWDHESGVRFPPSDPPASWGESLDPLLTYHTQSVKESLSCVRIRDQAFSRQIDTPIISSLVCRSGPPRTTLALGGEGQQSLLDPMDPSSSFLTPIPSHTYRSIHRAVVVFLYPKPRRPKEAGFWI